MDREHRIALHQTPENSPGAQPRRPVPPQPPRPRTPSHPRPLPPRRRSRSRQRPHLQPTSIDTGGASAGHKARPGRHSCRRKPETCPRGARSPPGAGFEDLSTIASTPQPLSRPATRRPAPEPVAQRRRATRYATDRFSEPPNTRIGKAPRGAPGDREAASRTPHARHGPRLSGVATAGPDRPTVAVPLVSSRTCSALQLAARVFAPDTAEGAAGRSSSHGRLAPFRLTTSCVVTGGHGRPRLGWPGSPYRAGGDGGDRFAAVGVLVVGQQASDGAQGGSRLWRRPR